MGEVAAKSNSKVNLERASSHETQGVLGYGRKTRGRVQGTQGEHDKSFDGEMTRVTKAQKQNTEKDVRGMRKTFQTKFFETEGARNHGNIAFETKELRTSIELMRPRLISGTGKEKEEM